MTREEAINHGKEQLKIFGGEHKKFIEMAIEALQAQATLDDVSTAYENGYKQGKFEAQQWIPVSERLPKEGNTTYLTTVDYGEFGGGVGQRFFYNKNIGWEDDAVVAWMPLPEPYTEEEQ